MDKLFDLIKETKDNIQNAPSEYPVNLILTGQDAARMHFLVSLYTSYFEKFTEEDIIKDAIHDYISNNRLNTKGFYYLIKKLKNLQLEDLPDLQA